MWLATVGDSQHAGVVPMTAASNDKTWRDQAACIGMPESMFFIERGQSDKPAKAVCAGCPVIERCLQFALDNGEQHGVWGGTSERQRRRMRVKIGRTHTPVKIAACGTPSGAFRHRKRGEVLCGPCLAAAVEYDRVRRARLRAEKAT